MIRTYRTTRKTLTLEVVGPRVIVRKGPGRRQARTFRNRYALRKYLTHKIEATLAAGYEAV